ncbi:hypothetical protein N7528_003416 [Penicillium herquei]|nr:hypothetical protein N7528_003416 [Penicillium herquei]
MKRILRDVRDRVTSIGSEHERGSRRRQLRTSFRNIRENLRDLNPLRPRRKAVQKNGNGNNGRAEAERRKASIERAQAAEAKTQGAGEEPASGQAADNSGQAIDDLIENLEQEVVAGAQSQDPASQDQPSNGQETENIWASGSENPVETAPGFPLEPMSSANPYSEGSVGSQQPGGSEGSRASSFTAAQTRAFVEQFEDRGAQRQEWIENPAALNCPVGRTTMNIDELAEQHNIPIRSESPGDGITFIRGLGDSVTNNNLPALPSAHYFHDLLLDHEALTYNGYVGPGAIFMNDIYRDTTRTGRIDLPHISELAHASYTSHYPINTLRVIAFETVVNAETRRYLEHSLYTEANGLHWPSSSDGEEQFNRHAWPRGSAQYNALLGTPIGNVAAAIMLNSFDRGTRRIASIVTVGESHMEFVIEEIP